MLHALLHGKLDPAVAEPQRLEDTLTSIVFGTLAMVGAWETVAKWLGVDDASPTTGVRGECWFWPRLAGAVEPDVVLRLGQVLVVVEAKYRSGRNDLALEDPEDERTVDQIVRQYEAVAPPHEGRAPYPEPLERAVRECRLVQAFVVDGRRMRRSRREHRDSKDLLPKDARLNLITWQSLFKILMEPETLAVRWSTDLRAYLRLAGLDTFQGVRSQAPLAAELHALSCWSSVGNRTAVPGIRLAAAALAAEPAIFDLRGWHASGKFRNRSEANGGTR